MKIHEQRMVNISDIKPYANNARTHSTQQIEQIVKSIKAFGFTNPLLVDDNFNLIAGHGRLEAVKQLNKIDYMFRYIYFLDKKCIKDLTCEIIPFSKIKEMGASMYKGVKNG